MPATLLIKLDQPESRPTQTCLQCGANFLPHRVGDGAEELCVKCYRTRFETLPGGKRRSRRHEMLHLGRTA